MLWEKYKKFVSLGSKVAKFWVNFDDMQWVTYLSHF